MTFLNQFLVESAVPVGIRWADWRGDSVSGRRCRADCEHPFFTNEYAGFFSGVRGVGPVGKTWGCFLEFTGTSGGQTRSYRGLTVGLNYEFFSSLKNKHNGIELAFEYHSEAHKLRSMLTMLGVVIGTGHNYRGRCPF